VETFEEIRQALARLPFDDRLAIEVWLQEYDSPGTRAYEVREAGLAYSADELFFNTLAEFLDFEERSPIRHEWVDGTAFAMSAPTLAHQRICLRLTMAFANHLPRGGLCQVFSSGTKLSIRRESSEVCYCPDLMIDCRRDAWDPRFVRKPKLVIEILSPSTQLTDRREKLHNYREVDSIEEYVLVAQDEHKLTLHRRADGWRPRVYRGPQAVIEFRSIDLALPLNAIYEDIL
jgi:Uma2 family endonuclease